MATGLQIKTSNNLISGGYPGEPVGVDGGLNNWTNSSLSGSVTATYYFYDSDYGNNTNTSRVECVLRDSWSASIDEATNKMTVTITSTIVSLARTQIIGSPNIRYGRRYRAWNANNRSQLVLDVWEENIGYTRTYATNVQVQQQVITLNPSSEYTTGTLYFRGNTGGHDDDGTPSKYVDEMSFGISLKNTLPAPPPKPTLNLTSQSTKDCQTVDARVRINQARVNDFNATNTYYRYKIGDGGYTSWILAGTSASQMTVTLNALPAETKIYVQAYTRGDSTNGATSDTLEFTTMARPPHAVLSLSSQTAESSQTTVSSTISYTQEGVSNFDTLITYLRYKVEYDGTWSDWIEIGRNSASGTYTIKNLPQWNDLVYVETYSTGNGICSSDTGSFQFKTLRAPYPPKFSDGVQSDTGNCINVTMPWVQDDTELFSDGKTYYSYRIADGSWSEWFTASNWKSGSITLGCVDYSTQVCFRAYTVAGGLRGEMSRKCITTSNKAVDDTPYEGDAFINTILCNSMLYLVELICQEWYAIREGDMEVYTNEETKKQCHGDEDDPTLHSILSRIYRFIGAMSCLVCSGLNDDLNYHKRGAKQRVLQSQNDAGDYGVWTPTDTVPTEGSTALVTSDGVDRAVDKYIHSVYHYVGTWGYLTLNETTLNELRDVVRNATAIVKNGAGGTNQEYVYNGSKWTAGDVQDFDDFSLVHVIYDSSWTYEGNSVAIKEGTGWYWYNNNWNQLDAVTEAEEAIIDEISDNNYVLQQAEDEDKIYYKVLERNGDGSVTSPGVVDKRTVYFITEDASPVTVTFDSCGGSEVSSQSVDFNETATKPADPTMEGFRFQYWVTVDYSGSTSQVNFNTQRFTHDTTLYALWFRRTYNAVFYGASSGGTKNFYYDHYISPPDAVVSAEQYFAAWIIKQDKTWIDVVNTTTDLDTLSPSDGDNALVQFGDDGDYQLYTYDAENDGWDAGDVLSWDFEFDRMPAHDVDFVALYRDKYTITFISAGGSEVETQYVAPTETVTEPTAPTRTMYRFDGWTVDGVELYDFDSIVQGDITLTAMWTPYHTVTFDADGGEPAPEPQIVLDGDTATEPEAPQKDGYYFNGWIKEEGE